MKKTRFGFVVWIALAACAVLYIAAGAQVAMKGALVIGVVALTFLLTRRDAERATAGKGRFMQLQAEACVPDCTFGQVAANDEALESLRMLADYLNSPGKYEQIGARMPRGVLLYGPPGTGKTLLARALAGEAGVPFFPLSGSDFVQLYVGVGASRVRELFAKARKAGRCVIFIDEIDAMGKRRDDGTSDERDQTLNALLSEMSGFRADQGIIVLAATNRIDTLDPALLRPGRFDRRIEVGLPGKRERLAILQLHSRGKAIAGNVDLRRLASDTVQFSGASLESLLNEAAIRAAVRGGGQIEQGDIDRAFFTTVAGADRTGQAASREELNLVALHEAGHAIASAVRMPENRLARISILPAGHGAAGYNLSIPEERTVMERARLEAQLDVLLAGRAAELLVGGADQISSGASGDLQRAGELAACMVMDLGMAEEPAISLRALQKGCQSAGPEGQQQARALLNARFEAVMALLSERVGHLMELSELLLARETLSGDELSQALAWAREGAPADEDSQAAC